MKWLLLRQFSQGMDKDSPDGRAILVALPRSSVGWSPLNQTAKPNAYLKKAFMDGYTQSCSLPSAPVPLVRKGDTQAVGLQWRSEDGLFSRLSFSTRRYLTLAAHT